MSNVAVGGMPEEKTAALGCIVCRNLGYYDSPATIHHLRSDVGMGQRSKRCIPLCPAHHQHGPDAFHYAPKSWQDRFGSEDSLWTQVQALL